MDGILAQIFFLRTSRTPINRVSTLIHSRINVVGKVIMTSGVHSWQSLKGQGQKLYFDIADETGIIRVFAWDDAAIEIDDLIQRGKIIEISGASVKPRKIQFNNLPHPYEMHLNYSSSGITVLPDDTNISVPEEEPAFIQFSDVMNFRENEYFNITGKICAIYPEPPDEGIGHENQNPYTRQVVKLQDHEGNIIKVTSWNGYIPLNDELLGKTMSLIRCKYVHEWDNVNSSGSLILIDGEQIS